MTPPGYSLPASPARLPDLFREALQRTRWALSCAPGLWALGILGSALFDVLNQNPRLLTLVLSTARGGDTEVPEIVSGGLQFAYVASTLALLAAAVRTILVCVRASPAFEPFETRRFLPALCVFFANTFVSFFFVGLGFLAVVLPGLHLLAALALTPTLALFARQAPFASMAFSREAARDPLGTSGRPPRFMGPLFWKLGAVALASALLSAVPFVVLVGCRVSLARATGVAFDDVEIPLGLSIGLSLSDAFLAVLTTFLREFGCLALLAEALAFGSPALRASLEATSGRHS